MIAVIGEKPSVARDIARILGANEKQDGYLLSVMCFIRIHTLLHRHHCYSI